MDRRLVVTLAAVALVALLLIGSIATSLTARRATNVDEAALIVDSDDDGIPDVLENYGYGTDAQRWNSSSVPIPDGWLVRFGFSPLDPRIEEKTLALPPAQETPGSYGPSGLSNFTIPLSAVYAYRMPDGVDPTKSVFDNGIDPTRWDQTGIGIPTMWLMRFGLDPTKPPPADEPLATGQNGLTLREAFTHNVDPRVADTDGDGIGDRDEVFVHKTDPALFSSARSGVPDGWLVHHGFDAHDPELPHRDIAKKGMTIVQTYQWNNLTFGVTRAIAGDGLDPHRMSTLSGKIPDGWLVAHGLDPLDSGIEGRVTQQASDFAGVRDLPTIDDDAAGLPSCLHPIVAATDRSVSDCELTVLDQYDFGKPVYWREAEHGPWWGGLDPQSIDADRDGLPDAVEVRGWFIDVKRDAGRGDKEVLYVRSDPLRGDSDGDGLTDAEEHAASLEVAATRIAFSATDPANPDTDYDGLDDGFEVQWGPKAFGDRYRPELSLDPADADTAQNELPDGEAYAYWSQRYANYQQNESYEFPDSAHRDLEWMRELASSRSGGGNDLVELFAPHGDADLDGVPNLLDFSSRGNDLADGWAVKPETLANSMYGASYPRSVTDPANPDTSGSGLPDAWKLRYGIWDASIPGWNLDPARWSSFHDDVSDAVRDLDSDGVAWSKFTLQDGKLVRSEQRYEMTNEVEFRFGTDPNRADTSRDGLADGWKAFWGLAYPSLSSGELGAVYPGAPGDLTLPLDAPRIDPLGQNAATIASIRYVRFSSSVELQTIVNGISVAETLQRSRRVADADGPRDVHKIEGVAHWTLENAATHETNPYLLDTDGDGLPDAWEVIYGLDPLDASDATQDPDADGLTNLQEFWGIGATRDLSQVPLRDLATFPATSDPTRADTDSAGLPDGLELLSGLDRLDEADDATGGQALDSDCDGLSDFEEILGHLSSAAGGRVKTDPLDPDTDHDGLLDGSTRSLTLDDENDASCFGAFHARGVLLEPLDETGAAWRAYGEADVGSDPTRGESMASGMPDGWVAWAQRVASRSLSADLLRAAYREGRPAWWTEDAHGPWWWGRTPTQPASTTDRDCNGLDDRRGEDAFLGANALGVLTFDNVTLWDLASFGEFVKLANNASDALVRAQSLGDHAWKPRDCSGSTLPPRASVSIVLDTFGAASTSDAWNATDASVPFRKGASYDLVGRVISNESSPAAPEVELNDGAGIANVTVIVSVNTPSNVVGIAVTNATGGFIANVSLAPDRTFPITHPGVPVLGRAAGEVDLDVDPALVSPGNHTRAIRNHLIVWTYNTSADPPEGHPQRQELRVWTASGVVTANGVKNATSPPVNVTVAADAFFESEFDEPPIVGERANLTLRLLDSARSPVANAPIIAQWNGTDLGALVTDESGAVRLALPASSSHLREPIILAFAGTEFISAARSEVNVPYKSRLHVVKLGADPPMLTPGTEVTVFGVLHADGVPAEGANVTIAGFNATPATSARDGSFDLRVQIPPTAPKGPFRLPVEVASTTRFTSASADLTIGILEQPILRLKVVDSVGAGETFSAGGTLTDANKKPLRNALIVIKFGDSKELATSTSRDGSFLVNLSRLDPGVHVLQVSFSGDGSALAPAQEATRVMVTSKTQLKIDLSQVVKGQDAEIRGQLVDALGRGIPRGHVHGVIDGDAPWSSITREDGSFVLSFSVSAMRTTSILGLTARYDGTPDGSQSPVSASLVRKVLTPLAFKVDTAVLHHGANEFTARAVALANTPLEPLRVTLTTSFGEAATLTRADGGLALRIEVPPNAYDARILLDLAFAGNDVFLPVKEQIVIPLVIPTRIDLVTRDAWILGGPAVLEGSVVDEHASSVPTGSLRVEVAEREIASLPIVNGRFRGSIAVPPDLPTGVQPLRLDFKGEAPYAEASLLHQVDVRASTVLTVEPSASVLFGRSGGLAFTLKGANGTPLQDTVVLVRDVGLGVSYAVRTDLEGRAIAPLSPGPSLRRDVALDYLGDGSSAAASLSASLPVVSLDVASFPWQAALSGLLLTLVAIAFILKRRLRRTVAAHEAIATAAAQLVAGDEYRATIFHLFRTLMRLAAGHGFTLAEGDTPRDLARRLGPIVPVGPQALQRFVEIFEQARYDGKPVGPSARDEAIQCFRAVKSELEARTGGT